MRWNVTWTERALNDLADRWLEAADKTAVNRAATALEAALARDAEGKGEDFYGDWIMELAPISVVFRIHPEQLEVEILSVMRGGK